ncbi:MAG: hypothetical protein HQ510_05105 [Candidatus Marinimicrobia bacterium]|nr:hypothetical protein [Candidatus Neomarinimicrobiota bacterium]
MQQITVEGNDYHMSVNLSIIATSRNDDHGGDTLKRMTLFVNGLITQTRKYQAEMELIIVEWNPPEGKPLLHEVLPTPCKEDLLKIRYIIVPENIHKKFRHGDTIPLFQMIAKNVGIRRATGKFVLCTNIDLLFSNDLFEKMINTNLDPMKVYRANRCDIPSSIDENWSFDQQLKFAEENIISTAGKNSHYTHLVKAPEWAYRYHSVAKTLQWIAVIRSKIVEDPIELQLRLLDTDACGDFTMMAKDAWMDIQGYPELDLYSIHVDSMGLIAAAALKYDQAIFPQKACTYHIHHNTGWASMSPVDKIRFWSDRPGIGWDAVVEAGKYLLENNVRYDVNPPDWGFSDMDLQEIKQ